MYQNNVIMKKILCGLLAIILIPAIVYTQSSTIPMGNESYHIMDRLEIKSGQEVPAPFFSTVKPYTRKEVTAYAIDVDNKNQLLSKRDSLEMDYIFKDNNDWVNQEDDSEETSYQNMEESYEKEYIDSTKTFYKLVSKNIQSDPKSEDRYFLSKKPIFKIFYNTPANLWQVDKPHFKLRINPVIHLKMGKEQGDESFTFHNTRGFDLRVNIDNRVYIHSNLYENQTRFPTHVTERNIATTSVPGAGFYKPYESSIFKFTDGYDYLNAQAYIAANITKHIHLQFGHGQNFIGNGHRSLFLSNYSNNYFYLKLNTQIWRFNFQNLFAELTGQFNRNSFGDRVRPKKYMAAHLLSFNIRPNINIGLFESVIFDRGNNFELQYLNPVIIYRTVEQALGSPDNVIFGLDFKWNFLKRFQLYGQIVLDEFIFKEAVVKRDGFWANKQGIQTGLKYVDVAGIDHLDLQLEYNSVRPYTYTHRDASANYTHYNQPLAHPLGANFSEVLAILRYKPIAALQLTNRLIYANYGTDNNDSNWGNNIFLSNDNRSAPDGIDDDFGHKTGQGIANKLLLNQFTASYQLRHNLYIDFDMYYRKLNSGIDANDYSRIFVGGGLRFNISDRQIDY